MTKFIKKPLSILLAALMIVSLFAVVPISASATTYSGHFKVKASDLAVGDILDNGSGVDATITPEGYTFVLKGGTYSNYRDSSADTSTDSVFTPSVFEVYLYWDSHYNKGFLITIDSDYNESDYVPIDQDGNDSLKWHVLSADHENKTITLGGHVPAPAPTGYTALIPTDSDDATALAAKQVTFNGKPWYIIEDNSTSENEGSITLLYADTNLGDSKFSTTGTDYSTSLVKTALDNQTAPGGAFYNVAAAIKSVDLSDVNVTGAKLYLLNSDEAAALPVNLRAFAFNNNLGGSWWLRNESTAGKSVKGVVGKDFSGKTAGTILGIIYDASVGIRPALQLDLSKVDYDSEAKTFTVTTDTQVEALAAAQNIDLDDYYLIPAEDMYFTLGKCWNAANMYERADNESGKNNVATKQFTINGLPKGSLIFSKAYIGFKVTAWNKSTNAFKIEPVGKRYNLLTKIDQYDWWESYTNFGFDVAKYDEGFTESFELTAADLASFSDMFRIYVPKPVDVAEVNGKRYPTLADAIRAAGAGDTVRLLRNAQENVVLNAGKDIVLNLNGKTLTNDGLHSTIIAQIGSKLRVTGNGTVDNTAFQHASLFNNGGTVILDGGTFIRSEESGKTGIGGNTYYTVVNRGTMTINEGVTIENDNYNYSSLIVNGYNSTRTGFREIDANISFGYIEGESSASPTLTINGGTFTGGKQALKNDTQGTAVITGGDFSSSTGNAVYNVGELKVEGGTFTATADGKFALRSASASGSATVTGGNFNGKLNKDEDAVLSVSGGSFENSNPEEYCELGYVSTSDGSGKYTVHRTPAADLSDGMVTVADNDKGKQNFGLGLGAYHNMQMLGIQKKGSIETEGGEDGIRFVTAINSTLLKGSNIDDYGYIVVKAKTGTSVDTIYQNMNKLTYEKMDSAHIFSCYGTSNTISGEFGQYASDTDYKYVTLALTGTQGSTDTVAARFYIKTKDGNYHYANYYKGNDVYGGMAFKLSDVTGSLV